MIKIQSVHPGGITSMSDSALTESFDVNVTSVHRMTSALMPLLKQGKKKTIINMYEANWFLFILWRLISTMISMLTAFLRSTSLGSISYASNFGQAPVPGYKISKAALNMLTVQYALEYGTDGFTVVAVSPGVCVASCRILFEFRNF